MGLLLEGILESFFSFTRQRLETVELVWFSLLLLLARTHNTFVCTLWLSQTLTSISPDYCQFMHTNCDEESKCRGKLAPLAMFNYIT